ncbi:hypothetical protein H8E88_11790 [candidate division KSB1 bacterium]|nr:hypothetical protein [candidate division KSB1 bacterium]MBL7092851.1 hypothetical protein [candidate division KSB1 bacterium]
MEKLKPKIGILFITSGWFREVGLQTSASPLSDEVQKIASEIIGNLPAFCEPIYNGVIYSTEDAEIAAQKINQANVDGLIISPLMWCEDQILLAALKNLPELPILICTFFPYESLPDYLDFPTMLKGSGSVGTLQMSGLLKREEYNYKSVAGYYRDENLFAEIQSHCLSFGIKQLLKKTRCGILPFPCDQMSTTFVDDFNIRKLYGVELKYLELQRFKKEAEKVTTNEIENFISITKGKCIEIEVDQKNLNEGAKYALAMEKVVLQEQLNILAMNDVCNEMHDCFGLRPSLTNPQLSESGLVVSMEADVAAGIGMFIMRQLTGETPFYTEPLTADWEKNAILLGHAGYHDSSNCDEKYSVKIIPDAEYKNSDPFTGACTYFKYKPGPVTVVNSVYNGKRLQFIAFEGNSLPGPPVLEGNCHLLCETNIPLKTFYEQVIQTGVSQHWIVIGGSHLKELAILCSWLNIDYLNLHQCQNSY